MDLIKTFVITLVSTIVFMTVIELITPNNDMKKYLKFVLGLILIATILNPIILFVKGGEASMITLIDGYEKTILKDDVSGNIEVDKEELRRKSFVDNFNKNCDELLKKEFKDMKFVSNVDCSINFNEVDFKINKLTIEIISSKVKKIDKVSIGAENKNKEDDETQLKIKKFISEELVIPEDKVEVKYG